MASAPALEPVKIDRYVTFEVHRSRQAFRASTCPAKLHEGFRVVRFLYPTDAPFFTLERLLVHSFVRNTIRTGIEIATLAKAWKCNVTLCYWLYASYAWFFHQYSGRRLELQTSSLFWDLLSFVFRIHSWAHECKGWEFERKLGSGASLSAAFCFFFWQTDRTHRNTSEYIYVETCLKVQKHLPFWTNRAVWW